MDKITSAPPSVVEKEVARLLYASARASQYERATLRSVASIPSHPGSSGGMRSHVEVEMSPGLEVMGMCRNFFEPFVSATWARRLEKRLQTVCGNEGRSSKLIVDHYLTRSETTRRWLCRILPGYSIHSERTTAEQNLSVRVRETTFIRNKDLNDFEVQVEVQTKQPIGHVTFAPSRLRDKKATFHSTVHGVVGIQPSQLYGMRLRSNIESSWTAWKRATPLPLNGVIISNTSHARITLRTTYALPRGIQDCVAHKTPNKTEIKPVKIPRRPVRVDVCRVWEGSTLRSAQACMERGELPSVAVELEYTQAPVPRLNSVGRTSGNFSGRPPRYPRHGTRASSSIPKDMMSWVQTAKGVLRDTNALFELGL